MKILSNLPPFYRGIPNIVIKYRVKSDDPKSNSNSTIMFVIPRVFCINISLPELEKNKNFHLFILCSRYFHLLFAIFICSPTKSYKQSYHVFIYILLYRPMTPPTQNQISPLLNSPNSKILFF